MSESANKRLRLFVSEDTPPNELLEFVRDRIKKPIKIGGKYVYDFSNHDPDLKALEEAVSKDRHSVFVIPFSVSAVWSYIAASLPRALRTAPALVYAPNRKVYSVFVNPFYKLPEAEYRKIRFDLEDLLPPEVRG